MVLYWILRPLMVLFYKIFYRVTVFGKENLIKKGKCVVICNHLGKMDVFVVGKLYSDRTIFMSKIEWYKNKFFGYILKCLGSIPLDRDNPSVSSIKAGLKVLKDNKRLGIFPEGRRNFETNELQEIKPGAAMFAFKGEAQITPVIIYDRLKMFKRAYVYVGKPFDFSEYYGQRFSGEVSEKCTEKMEKVMRECRVELERLIEEKNSKKSGKKCK